MTARTPAAVLPIPRSGDVMAARAAFLESVGAWAHACMARYADAPATDVHDQATYTTAWLPYLQATGDGEGRAFMQQARDRIRDHFVATDQWHHGYWRIQEAHHGTEHFELFLGALLALDPGDAATQNQLLDAVEHVGNWVAGVPAWYDADTGLFRSMYMGTETVRTAPGMALNLPDHLRYVNLLLLADAVGARADRRYLDLAAAYGRIWAEALLSREALPIALTPEGPVYALDGAAESVYRSFAGMAGHLGDNVDRAENLLASNGTGALLRLWDLTRDAVFLQAAERVLDILVTQLDDPDAGAAAEAVRDYRRLTGSGRYDGAVVQAYERAAAEVDPRSLTELGLEPDVQRTARPRGIGKRADQPRWYEDGRPRRHSPLLMAVAAEIRADAALTACTLDLAHAYFNLARATLPDGRHHGCAANTVSAVARGHGRENNAGMVTAVLGKVLVTS